MALSASPPPHALTTEQEAHSLQLDDDIASVRAEIAALTQRRNRLTSALLASTQTQSRLRQHPIHSQDPDLTTLLNQHTHHNQRSTYRLAFGVTAFPFTDPSPDTSNIPLTGLRFDIPNRNGTFDTPYYVMCQRVNDESSELKVHRHTIPALVPLAKYEEAYLPLSDEGYGSEDSMLGVAGRQDLQGFFRAVRSDLASWHLRKDSIQMVREGLGLKDKEDNGQETTGDDEAEEQDQLEGLYGIVDFEPVAVDARSARVVWSDGRVGRVKIGDDGIIQAAAVIGVDDQRHRGDERILVSGKTRIDTLIEKFKEIHERNDQDQAESD